MCGQKFGRNLEKPLRIERNRNGQEKNSCSTTLENMKGIYFVDPDDEKCEKNLMNARKKLQNFCSNHGV